MDAYTRNDGIPDWSAAGSANGRPGERSNLRDPGKTASREPKLESRSWRLPLGPPGGAVMSWQGAGRKGHNACTSMTGGAIYLPCKKHGRENIEKEGSMLAGEAPPTKMSKRV